MKEICSYPPCIKFSYIVTQRRVGNFRLPHISEGLVSLNSCCEIGMDAMIYRSFCGYFCLFVFPPGQWADLYLSSEPCSQQVWMSKCCLDLVKTTCYFWML